jgi:hypothetical protein
MVGVLLGGGGFLFLGCCCFGFFLFAGKLDRFLKKALNVRAHFLVSSWWVVSLGPFMAM